MTARGCPICGGSLEGRRSNARYCSPLCKGRANTQRHRKGHAARQRDYYARNREARLAYAAEYRKKHKERLNTVSRKYYEENGDVLRARGREYAAAHRERRRAAQRRWVAANRDSERERRRRRALTLPTGEYADLVLGDPCSYCGAPAEEVDHVIPMARGGVDEGANYTAACRSCNTKKHANSVLHFMRNRLIDAELQGAA